MGFASQTVYIGDVEAPIIYVPNFVKNADEVFTRLRDELTWEKRDDAPRMEYYCNDIKRPYVYGRGAGRRTYEVQEWHPAILEIRKALEEYTKAIFEVCFLNRYVTNRDHLGWHSDNSPEMDDSRPIVTISFGAPREIWFREMPDPKLRGQTNEAVMLDQSMDPGKPPHLVPSIEKLVLEHGSMCIMQPGMQDTHQHRIPKASYDCGERISQTWRGWDYKGAEAA